MSEHLLPLRLGSSLTKEVFHQVPIDSPRLDIAKRDDRSCNLPDTKVLHLGCKLVRRIERPGLDLSSKLAVSEHLRGQGLGRPVRPRPVENGLVEDVVIPEKVVRAAGPRSVQSKVHISRLGRAAFRTYLRLASCSKTLCWFKWSLCRRLALATSEHTHVGVSGLRMTEVHRQARRSSDSPGIRPHIQREESRVRLRVSRDGHLKHQLREGAIEVETFSQPAYNDILGELPAIPREEPVVCEGIQHGAGSSDYQAISWSPAVIGGSLNRLTVVRARCLPFTGRLVAVGLYQ